MKLHKFFVFLCAFFLGGSPVFANIAATSMRANLHVSHELNLDYMSNLSCSQLQATPAFSTPNSTASYDSVPNNARSLVLNSDQDMEDLLAYLEMAQELGMGLEELDLEMFGQEVDQTSEVVFTDPLTAAGGGTALVVIFFLL